MRPFLLFVVSLAWFLAGCDSTDPETLRAGSPASPATASAFTTGGPSDDLVTSDASAFAAAVRAIGNENELLVVLKDAAAARIGEAVLRDLPLDAPLVVARPEAPGPVRAVPGLAPAGAAARAAALSALAALGVEPYRAEPWAGAVAVRVPDAVLEPAVAALLALPAVDYIEANQKRPVTFDDGPQGTNPASNYHTFHNVLDAWDYTRGAGAVVGILDSGFAFDFGAGQYHRDGQLLTSTHGVQKIGFVDDYDAYNNCDETGGQPYGDCVPWDDQGHGTAMAGVSGANDNSVDLVGVAPEALTVSMKVAQNCNLSNDGCGSRTFYLEDDDMYHAVTWARYNGVDVLSMSFSTDLGSSAYNAMYDAYYTGDILLVSSTGNSAGQDREPQKWSFVMGVGGLDTSGGSIYNEEYEEVSALAASFPMLAASCPTTSFCTPTTTFVGNGTSPATALVAAVAGLVRTYNPSLSAAQTRQRLKDTATGPYNRVDAFAAVTNIRPLQASVDGPSLITESGSYTWDARVSYGTGGPYTYTWERSEDLGAFQTVGSGSTYSEFVDPAFDGPFTLRLTVTTPTESDVVAHNVDTYDMNSCGGAIAC